MHDTCHAHHTSPSSPSVLPVTQVHLWLSNEKLSGDVDISTTAHAHKTAAPVSLQSSSSLDPRSPAVGDRHSRVLLDLPLHRDHDRGRGCARDARGHGVC